MISLLFSDPHFFKVTKLKPIIITPPVSDFKEALSGVVNINISKGRAVGWVQPVANKRAFDLCQRANWPLSLKNVLEMVDNR